MRSRHGNYAPLRPSPMEPVESVSINGRHVEPGVEVKVEREPGRWRVTRIVEQPDGETVVDALHLDKRGKPDGGLRTFRVGRIKTVHRLRVEVV